MYLDVLDQGNCNILIPFHFLQRLPGEVEYS